MDPALWELLRDEGGADGDRVLEAIIRLARPGIEIPDIRIVSRFGTVATCRIRARDIVPVRARRDVVSLKAARGLSPGLEPAAGAAVPDALPRADFRPADVRRDPGLTLTGKGVVVASVDWGVDVDSAAFRWPAGPAAAGGDLPAGGTRFLSFWDQRDLAAGPRPDPYGYGTVHDREQIDRALHDPRPYERLGYHPAIADRAGHGTHGTHVLDIAAGNGQAGGPAGIAPEADLVFVHLADRTTGGLANLGDSVRLLEAVDFISRTAGSQPCVINISAGRTCGPKDGTTLVERALDELLATTPGRFVVNSAGNYFGWRTHSCGRVAPGGSRSLTFITDPADITLNELEIWYDGADEFAVRIDPPGYAGGQTVRLGERSDLLIDGQAVGRVYHRRHDPNNGDNHIVAYIDPIGPAGNWTITLEALQVSSGQFHAWIERDDTCRGCQARFTPADSNPITTIGTITASRLPLIVGAYDGHDPTRPVAPFSSSGPSRDLRPKPDLVAPGVDVLAARSASIVDSHNPGLLVRKSGTSMATPHVTGAVALCLEVAGNTLSARHIRSLILGSCDPALDPAAPYRLGRGYLNIPRLIADLKRTLTAPGAKEPTMNTDDSIVLLAAAPATAYREYLYRPHSQLALWIDERFDVVARPGQRLDQAPQLGDVVLEVTLGRVRPGRCLVLKAHNPELEVSPRRLHAGQLLLRPRKRAEMSEPLPVEPTVETEGSNPATDVAAGAPTAAVPDFRQPEEAAMYEETAQPLPAPPSHTFRELLYWPHSDLARWVHRRFEVLGRPCEKVTAPRCGDLLITIRLGGPGAGICTIVEHRYTAPRQLGPNQLLLRPRSDINNGESFPMGPSVEEAYTPPHVRKAKRIWDDLFAASPSLRSVRIADLSRVPSPIISASAFSAWTNSPNMVYVRNLGAVDDAVWQAVLYHESLHVKQFRSAGGKPPSNYATMMRYECEAYTESARWVAARWRRDPNDIAGQMRATAKKLCNEIARTEGTTTDPNERDRRYREFLIVEELLPPHRHIRQLYTPPDRKGGAELDTTDHATLIGRATHRLELHGSYPPAMDGALAHSKSEASDAEAVEANQVVANQSSDCRPGHDVSRTADHDGIPPTEARSGQMPSSSVAPCREDADVAETASQRRSEPEPEERSGDPTFELAEGSAICAQARLKAVGHDEASARLVTLLKQPLGTADRAGLQRRIGELTALLQSLSADQKAVLSRRLNDPTDALAHLFDCELHHESRRRLRALLQVPRSASPTTQPQAEPGPLLTASPCVRDLGHMTALLPWERSFLALINGTDTMAFEGAVILIGPIFPGPFFSSIQKLIVTTALKHGYAITIGNNMWFPSPLDTSSVNKRGVHTHLGWLVHESVHMLDYDRVGIEAYLTSYIQKAVVAGFSHDDIPDERRADHFESAALGLLSRSPELARLISTCDNDAISADLASRRSIYRRAVMEASPEEHEEIERIEVQPPEEGTDELKRVSNLNRVAWIPPRDSKHDAYADDQAEPSSAGTATCRPDFVGQGPMFRMARPNAPPTQEEAIPGSHSTPGTAAPGQSQISGPQLVRLAVIGATQKNVTGHNNWVAVKRVGAHVIVEARTAPDDTPEEWKRIQWWGGKPVAGRLNQRRVPRASSKKIHVEASLGGARDYVDVWIIYASIEIKVVGMRPPNAAPFDPGTRDESDRLGPVTYESSSSSAIDVDRGIFVSNRGASGKVTPVAKLSPRGLSEVVKSGWAFQRQLQSHEWMDGYKQQGPKYWTRTWANDMSSSRYLRLTPDSDDKIYDLDAPDIRWGNSSFETYNNFRQWIEWNGDMCSDYAYWHWRARWKLDQNPHKQIKLNDLGTGLIRLPAEPYFHAAR